MKINELAMTDFCESLSGRACEEPAMEHEVHLISDGEGLAVIGDATSVEHFIESLALVSVAKDFGFEKLRSVARAGGEIAEIAIEAHAKSSRWLKLTDEAWERVKQFGLMETATPGVRYAMVGQPGNIKSWVQVEGALGSLASNPAILAGAAGVMAQFARQHEMNEIKAYLAKIVENIDDVLRGQKIAELKVLRGARADIDYALSVLRVTGVVDDDTWSRVAGTSQDLSKLIGWALLKFADLANQLERTTDVGKATAAAKAAVPEVQELLVVMARSFELQDELDVLQIERALHGDPAKLDRLRIALDEARRQQRDASSREMAGQLARMSAVVETVNGGMIPYPSAPRVVVAAVGTVQSAARTFLQLVGVPFEPQPLEATNWWQAAKDVGQWKAAANSKRGEGAIGTAVTMVAGAAVLARHFKNNNK